MDREVTPPADNPGVIVLPPLLYGTAFLMALVLHWRWPMRIFDSAAAPWLSLVPFLLGLVVDIRGIRAMKAAGTNVDPSRPATAIVTSGPFRFSRNPLYLGMTLFYGGLTLAIDSWWGFLMLIPVLAVMHWGVILREERYLERKFGEPYRQYRSKVRRYF